MDIFDTGLVKLLTEILHIRCLPSLPPPRIFSSLLSLFLFRNSSLDRKKKKTLVILSTHTIPRNWYRYLRVTALLYVFAGNISEKLQFESRCQVLKSIAPTSWLCPFFSPFPSFPNLSLTLAFIHHRRILRWWSNYDIKIMRWNAHPRDNYRKFFKKKKKEGEICPKIDTWLLLLRLW